MACPNSGVDIADARFPELHEYYKAKNENMEDEVLVLALHMFRERYHDTISADWFPSSPREYGRLTRYIHHSFQDDRARYEKEEAQKAEAAQNYKDAAMRRETDSVSGLYETLYNDFAPDELDKRVNKIANDIRVEIDDLEDANTIRGRSRMDLVSSLAAKDKSGLQVLVERVFAGYREKADAEKQYGIVESNYTPEELAKKTPKQKEDLRATLNYKAQQYEKILRHEHRLALLALRKVGEYEGFKVTGDLNGYSYEEITQEDIEAAEEAAAEEAAAQSENGDYNEAEDRGENTKGERFADYSVLKLLESVSPRLKRIFSRLEVRKPNGDYVYDDLSSPVFVDPRQAIALIRYTLLNSTPETMVEDLQAAAGTYGWVNSLLEYMEEDESIKPLVWQLKSVRTNWGYTVTGNNGEPIVKEMHTNMAGQAFAKQVIENLEGGVNYDNEFHITDRDGNIIPEKLKAGLKAFNEELKDWSTAATYVNPAATKEQVTGIPHSKREKFVKDHNEFVVITQKSGKDAIEALVNDNPDKVRLLARLIRGLGFVLSDEDVRTVLLYTPSGKVAKQMLKRTGYHNNIERVTKLVQKAYDIRQTDQEAMRTGIYSTVQSLAKALAFAKNSELETRVRYDNKSLSIYTPVNLMHQVFDKLSMLAGSPDKNSQPEVVKDYKAAQKFVYDNFWGMEDFMLLDHNPDGSAYYRLTGILKRLLGGKMNKFRLITQQGFNHVEYAKMSLFQKKAAAIINAAHNQYQMPMSGDYETAYHFVQVSDISDEDMISDIKDELKLEIQRIQAIMERKEKDPGRAKLTVQESEGMKFHMFPALNGGRFMQDYAVALRRDATDPKGRHAEKYLDRVVRQQLGVIWEQDRQKLEKSHALSHPAMNSLLEFSLYSPDGTVAGIDQNEAEAAYTKKNGRSRAEEWLRGWSLHSFYYNQQLNKILYGGLHNFNGLSDFNKRSMMANAQHTSMYTAIEGMKKYQNAVYLGDSVAKSTYIDKEIIPRLKALKDADLITEAQYKDYVKTYTSIKETDGFAVRTLESYRDMRIMEGDWTERDEHAYQRLQNGTYVKDDIQWVLRIMKPVYTGYEYIASNVPGQMIQKIPVLHKYAECVLLPKAVYEHIAQTTSVPMQALAGAAERLHGKIDNNQGLVIRKKIEMLQEERMRLNDTLTLGQRVTDAVEARNAAAKENGKVVNEQRLLRQLENGSITEDQYLNAVNDITKYTQHFRHGDNLRDAINDANEDDVASSAALGMAESKYRQEKQRFTNHYSNVDEFETNGKTTSFRYITTINALDDQIAQLQEDLENANRDTGNVDVFLFGSDVKSGLHSQIEPFATWGDIKGHDGLSDEEARREHGWTGQSLDERILKDEQSIEDYIVSAIEDNIYAVHQLSLDGYGIAASTPDHLADQKITMAAQAETCVYGNILEDDEITLDGRKVKATEGRKMFYQLKASELAAEFAALRKMFSNAKELQKIIKDEIAERSYTSPEIEYAFDSLYAGKFGVPLYSPNVEHEVQAVITSIIKKHLNKHKAKGANIYQASSFGMDMEASAFDNQTALSENDQLKIEWEGEGENRHIKYIEVYMPIHDTRLLRFADENGQITPERLEQLIEDGSIDESILYFVAYRTPSDAEHSVLPCRIKGFIAPAGGANIYMPKEVEALTGNDFDGDKMRCHFIDFVLNTNEKALDKVYENRSEAYKDMPREKYIERLTRSHNFDGENYIAAKAIKYDFSRKPLEQSQRARDNAKVQLLFAQITSPAGTRKMLMPGGFDSTKKLAKSVYILKISEQGGAQDAITDALMSQGVDRLTAIATANDTLKLKQMLDTRSAKQLDAIIDTIKGASSPFSQAAQDQTFSEIMGGQNMIGIYAMYNAAIRKLQRLDMHYEPRMTEGKDDNSERKPYRVAPFGKEWDRLFDVLDSDDNYSALAMAHFLQAGVDNTKDPILNLINQTPQLSDVTFMMLAAGMTEEEVVLILNQPAVTKVLDVMGENANKISINNAIQVIREAIVNDNPSLLNEYDIRGALGANYKADGSIDISPALAQFTSLGKFNEFTEEDFQEALPKDFDSLVAGDDLDAIEKQLAVLGFLDHIAMPAHNLSDFVRLTRPDASRGAFGTTIESIVLKLTELNDFIEKFTVPDNSGRVKSPGFTGWRGVLADIDVHEGWDTEWLDDTLDDLELPEVTVANSLLLRSSLDIFMTWFPQANKSWYDHAMAIGKMYNYDKVPENLLGKIGKEMILWRMLHDKRLVTGDAQEEQKRIITEMPETIAKLKRVQGEGLKAGCTDPVALALADNQFINQLQVRRDEVLRADGTTMYVNNTVRFMNNGPAIEGSADRWRNDWNKLLTITEDGGWVRQAAIDLFKYCLYTNGFVYGMYEFSHIAPMSIIFNVPGYLEALRGVMDYDWSDADDFKNFMNQYIMNHWGENRLVRSYSSNTVKTTKVTDEAAKGRKGVLRVSNKTAPSAYGRVAGSPYVVIRFYDDAGGTAFNFYRVVHNKDTGDLLLFPAEKLGFHGKYGQLRKQYNPAIPYTEMKAVSRASQMSWTPTEEGPLTQANIDNAPEQPKGFLDALVAAGPNGRGKTSTRVLKPGQRMRRGLFGGVSIVNADGSTARSTDEQDTLEATQQGAQEAARPQSQAQPQGQTSQQLSAEQQAADEDAWAQGQLDDMLAGQQMLSLSTEDTLNEDSTPDEVSMARRVKLHEQLNERLRDILRQLGVSVGVLDEFEQRLGENGVFTTDTSRVTAEGLVELIRLAKGWRGEEALPEEFAHLALSMLGREHPLVKRLFDLVYDNEDALREAFGGQEMLDRYIDEYTKRYGQAGAFNALVWEACGKLVSKGLLMEQEAETKPVKRLLQRVVDAIKEFLRFVGKQVGIERIQDAVYESENVASKIGRDLLGGRLLDRMMLDNLSGPERLLSARRQKVQKDLSDKKGVLNELLRISTKQVALLQNREGGWENGVASAPVKAAIQQRRKLETAMRKYKTEEAVVSYLGDTVEFLERSRDSYKKFLTHGYPANKICKKNNVIRDTIFWGYSTVEAVEQAIADGEIERDDKLDATLKNLKSFLDEFFLLNKEYSELQFEGMLKGVYGENGYTATAGRDKGKTTSIHEMATKAMHDISFAERMFNSLADCNDLALKAFDRVTKDAKSAARRATDELRTEIEVMYADLEREQGSGDQSFMFQYTKGKDGKMHKNGLYITPKQAESLTDAQRKFYERFMELKTRLDDMLPPRLTKTYKIIMLRKGLLDRVGTTDGSKNKLRVLWDAALDKIRYTQDDYDNDTQRVTVDFEGNQVDRLPLKFLFKGAGNTYDDMEDDAASSLLMYAAMANEYSHMNAIIPILENARYAMMERDVVQKTGGRTKTEKINAGGYIYNRPFTIKQARTQAMKALNDYLAMHVYQHLKKDEGPIGKTGISKRKTVDLLNETASLSQMAINIPQRVANVTTGFANILIEAAGKTQFTASDIKWAVGIWRKETGDRLADTGQTETDNKLNLFAEMFNMHQNDGKTNVKYGKGRLSRIFGNNLLYLGLQAGEDLMALSTGLAMARNVKMRDEDGNLHNLWDAFDVKYRDSVHNVGAYLALKKGWTKEDGTAWTAQDEDDFTNKVAAENFRLQGIYNRDDRSAAQQYALGALLIMYRKWIAPSIMRRFGSAQYSALGKADTEGYYNTMFRLLGDAFTDTKEKISEEKAAGRAMNFFDDVKAYAVAVRLNWNKLTPYEKGCITRAKRELETVAVLFLATSLLLRLPPSDHDDDPVLSWMDNFMLSQLLRLRSELGAMTPTHLMVQEGWRILQSPFAAAGPLKETFNVFQLLIPSNYVTTMKSGRYRGHTRAYKYFRDMPIISMFKRIDNTIDPSYTINYYRNSSAAEYIK